jgi:hypothetical protein
MAQPSLMFRVRNAVRIGFQFHGIWLPFVILQRLSPYTFRKLFVSQEFDFAGKRHRFAVNPFILNNERPMEIGIANGWRCYKKTKLFSLEVMGVSCNFQSLTYD